MEKLMDSFINNCGNSFLQYFERYRYKNLINREDYKALYDKKQTIFNEFPNVRTFLQDRMIIELTDDEKDAILRLLEIDEEIEKIEMKEFFKLGFKEAYIFFEEQNMLNV